MCCTSCTNVRVTQERSVPQKEKKARISNVRIPHIAPGVNTYRFRIYPAPFPWFIFDMCRVIRSKNTRHYLGNDGTWSRCSEAATSFTSAADAVAVKQRYNLRQVEIVLQMLDAPHPRYDLIVPLG